MRCNFARARRGFVLPALLFCCTLLSKLDTASAQSPPPSPGGGTEEAVTANPLSRSLTVFEFNRLQQTDVDVELETREEFAAELGLTVEELNQRAELYWEAATEFEFIRALTDEAGSDDPDPFPFLLCREGSASGYRHKLVLNAAISAASPPEPLPGSSSEVEVTLYNGDDMYCGLVLLAGSVAERLECDDSSCIVQPVHFFMKLMPGTVQLVLEMHAMYLNATTGADPVDGPDATVGIGPLNATDPVDFPSADIVLCPNVVDEDTIAAVSAGDAHARSDLTDEMTTFLLSKTGTGTADASPTVSESLFWTSSAAADLLRRFNRTTERAEFWAEVLTLSVETDLCSDTFANRLNWTENFYSPLASALHVQFDGVDAVEVDVYCVLAMIAGLSAMPEVCAVEVTSPRRVLNDNSQVIVQAGVEGIGQSGVKDERPFFDVGLNGKGQVVAVSDTGIDLNNCYFWDITAIPPSSIQLNTHRKVQQYRPFADDSDYKFGHGTHVAGTIAGRRAVDGVRVSDGAADGIARDAKIAFADIGTPRGFLRLPPDNVLLTTGRQRRPRAHIHSASWGAVGINYYNYQSQSFDDFVFRNDDLLINVAAGNDGRWNALNTVSSPATAKNILSIGSSQSSGNGLFPGQKGPRFVSSFSSRGTTADGRIKPDLIAPGENILSAGARPDLIGECDRAGIPITGQGRGGLVWMAGTSMATPVTSGTAAIVRQYFEEGWYPGGMENSGPKMMPSGALVKAILMNGAQMDMLGVDNGLIRGIEPVKPYDEAQGFGRVSLMDSLYIASKANVRVKVWDREVIAEGEARIFDIAIDRSNGCSFEYLSVTLVWAERGSVIGCKRCVLNDLDLYVMPAPGGDGPEKFYPNGRTRKDSTNNAERVIVSGVSDGENFTVHVEGHNLDGPSQEFSLVATGCFAESNDIFDNTSTPPPTQDADDEPDPATPPPAMDDVDDTAAPTSSPVPTDPTSSAPVLAAAKISFGSVAVFSTIIMETLLKLL